MKKEITFFHCGDIHFDIPFTSLSSKVGLPKKRREAIKNSFIKMIENIREKKPDFLFIAGDLYEHEYTNLKTIKWINELFTTIPDTHVILIAGNHDPEAKNSFYQTMKWSENVYYIGENNPQHFFKEVQVMIYGVGFGPGYGQSMFVNNIECETSNTNILLFHGDVDLDIGERDYNAISSTLLDSKGFDYVAVSHNHKYRNDFGKKGLIHNAGSLESLGFDETGKHGYITGTINEKGLSTIFVPLSDSPYHSVQISMTDIKDLQSLRVAITKNLTDKEKLYRIELTGKRQGDVIIDYKKIENILNQEVAFLRIKDNSKVIKSKHDTQTGLKALFIKEINDLIKQDDYELQTILQQALVYGIEAIEDEKVEITIEDVL